MSADPGKVQMLGVSEINGEKVMVLRFLQGRNPDWVQRPFFAQYDDKATWLDELRPAFGEGCFFYEDEMEGELPHEPAQADGGDLPLRLTRAPEPFLSDGCVVVAEPLAWRAAGSRTRE
jgi:hypothetical protein